MLAETKLIFSLPLCTLGIHLTLASDCQSEPLEGYDNWPNTEALWDFS